MELKNPVFKIMKTVQHGDETKLLFSASDHLRQRTMYMYSTLLQRIRGDVTPVVLVYRSPHLRGKSALPFQRKIDRHAVRLLYTVGLLISSATTSRWTPFATAWCNCKIQDGIQADK